MTDGGERFGEGEVERTADAFCEERMYEMDRRRGGKRGHRRNENGGGGVVMGGKVIRNTIQGYKEPDGEIGLK